jgi:hypothetical protein
MAPRLWVLPRTRRIGPAGAVTALAALATLACASSGPRGDGEPAGAPGRAEPGGPPARPTAVPNLRLAGARCGAGGAACVCRAPGDDAERAPPAEGTKRFEVRLAADRGEATLESPTIGRFAGQGATDTCYYVDLVAGSQHDFFFSGRAADVDRGFAPRLVVREYGPKGPWWYDVVEVECNNGQGRCDRRGTDLWKESLKRRKRGRLEPCGSVVVTGLDWETSGGLHDRDGGNYRDFTVKFAFEVKKFATAFAPGSTECVPK